MFKSFKTYIRRLRIQTSTETIPEQTEFFLTHGPARAGDIEIILRPASRADTAGALHMHARLSMDSLFMRYLRPYRPTAGEIEQICQMCMPEGAAYVAQLAEPSHAVIGLAYYRLDSTLAGEAAEPAIVIEDGFQGLGIGTALFNYMCRQARAAGIESFCAHTHPQNKKMRHLMNKATRRPVREKHHSQIVESRLELSSFEHRGRTGFWNRYMPERLFSGCDLGLDQVL